MAQSSAEKLISLAVVTEILEIIGGIIIILFSELPIFVKIGAIVGFVLTTRIAYLFLMTIVEIAMNLEQMSGRLYTIAQKSKDS
ncbi:MAG: hypothetical protein K2G25_07795 [Oscillospiraceae bacterium]|nr:hypothetical protein [Oscillospiraceae bacterium]